MDHAQFNPSEFKPYRLIALLLKSTRMEFPEFQLWTSPPYEYEEELRPFDILSGSSELRDWIEDPEARMADLEEKLSKDEKEWKNSIQDFLVYT